MALVEPAATLTAAQEARAVYLAPVAVPTVVLVLLAAIAAMSSQEMAAMQEVTQAVPVETAVMRYSTVAAEDQVLTASKPEVKSSKQ